MQAPSGTPTGGRTSAPTNITDPSPAMKVRGVLSTMVDRKEAERIEKLVVALSARAPLWLTELIKRSAPAIGCVFGAMKVAGPNLVRFYAFLFAYYKQLPKQAAKGLWGLCLCLFGGKYAVAIAAIESFKLHGGEEVAASCKSLKQAFVKLAEASREDDRIDFGGDSVRGAEQVDPRALLQRKLQLALRTLEPNRVMNAVGGVWTGYMGMLVILKFQFAQSIALAQSMADSLRPAASKALEPSLMASTPKEYQQWVSPMLNFACQAVTLTFAWRAQRILSIVQAATNGGVLASKSIIQYLHEQKYIDINCEDTMVDEILGWALAAFGIYYQLTSRDPVPLLLRPVFWPFGLLEAWMKWSMTYLVRDAPLAVKG